MLENILIKYFGLKENWNNSYENEEKIGIAVMIN